MTIITQRLVARTTKLQRRVRLKETQKLHPMVLEACLLKQQKKTKALQES